MIPTFPDLASISDGLRPTWSTFTERYPAYSDFSLTSLRAWDLAGKMRIGGLNGNLVVRFHNAETNRSFYSFLGDTNIESTAATLLAASSSEGLPGELRLVPEEVAREIKSPCFTVTEDRDNFDYLLDVLAITSYSGAQYQEKRRIVRNFWRRNHVSAISFDLPGMKAAIVGLCDRWEDDKQRKERETTPVGLYGAGTGADVQALLRLVSEATTIPLTTVGLMSGSELIAICICETGHGSTAMLHFIKADCRRFRGAHDAVLQEAARALARKDCVLINYQEDIGIPSLREAKMRAKPCAFLKKYTVRPATPM